MNNNLIFNQQILIKNPDSDFKFHLTWPTSLALIPEHIAAVNKVLCIGTLHYDMHNNCVNVKATFSGVITLIDALDLSHFEYAVNETWDETYYFLNDSNNLSSVNIIDDKNSFNLNNYAFDTLSILIPINLHQNML